VKFVLIIGSGAVGKMTVGQEIEKRTDLILFHNHMTIEPVLDIFGYCNKNIINKWRWAVFEESVRSEFDGLIFTYMWDFDSKNDCQFIKDVTDFYKKHNAEVYCIELVANQDVRLERNKTENRLNNKMSKRDLVASEERLLRADENHRLVSNDGEVQFDNYIKIDNTNLSPTQVVDLIMESFDLL
jgi:hypothetical protein